MKRRINLAGKPHAPSGASGRHKVERETVDGEPVVRVTFDHRSCAVVFLMVWLTFWSFGCFMLAKDLVKKPFSFKLALFSIPFFAAEIFVALTILMMLFGRTVFTFRREGGTRFSGIGRYGFTKEFTFPVKCEIGTDEVVKTSSKGRSYTCYRLVVKTPFDLDGPRVIYDSLDPDIVHSLHMAALEVTGAAALPKAKKDPDEAAAEAAESERRDLELLAGRPPKGLTVSRDFEGRVSVVLQRVNWALAIIPALVISGFTALVWSKFPELPVPIVVGLGVCMLFPLVQVLFVVFGKRTMTLDQGKGETFFGVGHIGARRSFEYGGAFDVRLEESGMWINNKRMNELVIAKPGGTPRKICTSWPNDVKPYLAALLRHPASAPAAFVQF